MNSRKWIEFQIVTKNGSSEFAEEGISPGFIDVNTIESFYTMDEGVVLEMKSGNSFLVNNDLDFVYGVVNEST